MSRLEQHREMFANRLRKTFKHRRRWAERLPTQAWRLYDRDIPEIPLVVDVYADHLHLADFRRDDEVEQGDPAWLDLLAQAAAEQSGTPMEHLHIKRRQRQRGTAQYETQDERSTVILVQEQGLNFEIELDRYLDTGLFLDHRVLRAHVRDNARDLRVLNLYAYTGSFSVYAMAGGARSVTTVDLSNTYLEWGRRNLQHNKLAGPRDERVRADTFEFLRHARDSRRQWELIIIDPPTFSNSSQFSGTFDVQRDHRALLDLATALLAPGGEIRFSTNRSSFKLDAPPALQARETTGETVPDDFRTLRPHRSWQLKRQTDFV